MTQFTAVDASCLNVSDAAHHIVITNDNAVTELDFFLSERPALLAVDCSILVTSLTKTGDCFLYGCDYLALVDFGRDNSALDDNAATVSECAEELTGTTNSTISALDVVGQRRRDELPSVPTFSLTTIGDHALSQCSSLTVVHCGGLASVTSIGASFLYDAISLPTIDLNALASVTRIGTNFMHGCASLTLADISGLVNLTELSNGFLSECFQLVEVKACGLSSVARIGDGCFAKCGSLEKVDFSGGLSSTVSHIGSLFLMGAGMATGTGRFHVLIGC